MYVDKVAKKIYRANQQKGEKKINKKITKSRKKIYLHKTTTIFEWKMSKQDGHQAWNDVLPKIAHP